MACGPGCLGLTQLAVATSLGFGLYFLLMWKTTGGVLGYSTTGRVVEGPWTQSGLCAGG